MTGLVLLALAVSMALLICHGPRDLYHQVHNGHDYRCDYGYDNSVQNQSKSTDSDFLFMEIVCF